MPEANPLVTEDFDAATVRPAMGHVVEHRAQRALVDRSARAADV